MDTVPNQLLQHFVEPVQTDVVYIGKQFLKKQLAPASKSALYSRYLGLRGWIKDRQSRKRRSSSLQLRIFHFFTLNAASPTGALTSGLNYSTSSSRRTSASPVPLAETPNQFTSWIPKSGDKLEPNCCHRDPVRSFHDEMVRSTSP